MSGMQGKKFRYLPHTADIAFIASGIGFKKALENSAEALLNIMLDLKKIRRASGRTEKIEIRESANGQENLVWYTLQDILTKVDGRKLHAYGFRIKSLKQDRSGRMSVAGSLLFKRLKSDPFLLEVKAVTPHDLSVATTGKRCAIKVLVDV